MELRFLFLALLAGCVTDPPMGRCLSEGGCSLCSEGK